MIHGTLDAMPNNCEVKRLFQPKNKNRNGSAEKRITELDHTLGVKACQRESTHWLAQVGNAAFQARSLVA